MPDGIVLVGFGPTGWGKTLLEAAAMTVLVSVASMLIGALLGAWLAFLKLRLHALPRTLADAYITVFRGVPELLVIYLLYFGGSTALTEIGRWLGHRDFIGVPAFTAGAVAVGVVSAAYQAEVFRGAVLVLPKGEVEAARAVGMNAWLVLRRVTGPHVLRLALPGLGNVWQLALKDSALISVVGLVELLRASQVGAGSTSQPFTFYFAAILLYLAITTVSGSLFRWLERVPHARKSG
ncbi:ABC transporter permease [Paraburkholderia sp. ZP32-5]|uniref:ABC transporter permease n=1 Tax=Paraburkholderia sp. ZP32-5 TaxID=2883245 RepID=UPI001EEC6928|nr:ABC transporter permease subunit [Paraburkholderia sp. ZP32-5]